MSVNEEELLSHAPAGSPALILDECFSFFGLVNCIPNSHVFLDSIFSNSTFFIDVREPSDPLLDNNFYHKAVECDLIVMKDYQALPSKRFFFILKIVIMCL
ncbi:hypothetical protein HHI36_013185 [Cryptolaemus montrouzieri]|uniref:Uncharacterized protein n=1 Tax=Cryptolaemus montrouzieri TaxID=559131 RepID=A0ABD2NH38_9CUCU